MERRHIDGTVEVDLGIFTLGAILVLIFVLTGLFREVRKINTTLERAFPPPVEGEDK